MEYAIEIENLSKDYGTFQLKNISFRVPKGSIMGFVGENGAGKTTTIKLMINLIKKDAGTVKIHNLDNEKDEILIKEQIGTVFDDCYFHDQLKIKDISKIMGNIYKNWNANQFLQYCERFQLPNNKIVKEFSRGMKMKLSIAVALSHQAKLLILDEATAGLDPVVRDEILDIFLDFIQDEEHSILLSSHITSDIEKVADYITFIHKGEILFSKSKDDLLYGYGIAKCTKAQYEKIDLKQVVGIRENSFGVEVLVKDQKEFKQTYPEMIVDRANIEDILLFITRGAKGRE